MGKVKLIEPQENIEYTFVFPGGKMHTFRYHGLNEKGRLMFCNKRTDVFTSMTKERFSYLYRFQLKGTLKVAEPKPPIMKHKQEELKVADKLRAIETQDKENIYISTGIDVDELAQKIDDGCKNNWPRKEEHAELMGLYLDVLKEIN